MIRLIGHVDLRGILTAGRSAFTETDEGTDFDIGMLGFVQFLRGKGEVQEIKTCKSLNHELSILRFDNTDFLLAFSLLAIFSQVDYFLTNWSL